MLNTSAFKPDIGVHNVPICRFQSVVRQHFIRRLEHSSRLCAVQTAFRLLSVFPESTPISGPDKASRNWRDSFIAFQFRARFAGGAHK